MPQKTEVACPVPRTEPCREDRRVLVTNPAISPGAPCTSWCAAPLPSLVHIVGWERILCPNRTLLQENRDSDVAFTIVVKRDGESGTETQELGEAAVDIAQDVVNEAVQDAVQDVRRQDAGHFFVSGQGQAFFNLFFLQGRG